MNANQTAQLGIHGDNNLGHLAGGEVVVPVELQTEEVKRVLDHIFKRAGSTVSKYRVGSPDQQVNPLTGLPMFAWDEESQTDTSDSHGGNAEDTDNGGGGFGGSDNNDTGNTNDRNIDFSFSDPSTVTQADLDAVGSMLGDMPGGGSDSLNTNDSNPDFDFSASVPENKGGMMYDLETLFGDMFPSKPPASATVAQQFALKNFIDLYGKYGTPGWINKGLDILGSGVKGLFDALGIDYTPYEGDSTSFGERTGRDGGDDNNPLTPALRQLVSAFSVPEPAAPAPDVPASGGLTFDIGPLSDVAYMRLVKNRFSGQNEYVKSAVPFVDPNLVAARRATFQNPIVV